jgi:hypothetical protein
MTEELRRRVRYGEAFWRAHHEAWKRSELNQREYCEAERISLKAFGNWRAKFKAEPQPPQRKLFYRRGGSSHTLSHSSSHTLSHVLAGRPACSAATQGASAAVQRSREAPNPPRSSAARHKHVRGCSPLWDRAARSVSVEAGTGCVGIRGGADHRREYSFRRGVL